MSVKIAIGIMGILILIPLTSAMGMGGTMGYGVGHGNGMMSDGMGGMGHGGGMGSMGNEIGNGMGGWKKMPVYGYPQHPQSQRSPQSPQSGQYPYDPRSPDNGYPSYNHQGLDITNRMFSMMNQMFNYMQSMMNQMGYFIGRMMGNLSMFSAASHFFEVILRNKF